MEFFVCVCVCVCPDPRHTILFLFSFFYNLSMVDNRKGLHWETWMNETNKRKKRDNVKVLRERKRKEE